MDKENIMDDWISTDEAAELTGYSQEYIRQLARAGEIKSWKVGHATLISKKSILERREKYAKED